jgi:phage terminase large subunit GpA-like protein
MLIPQTTAPIKDYEHCAGRRYCGRPSRSLRMRLRTPEKLTVAEWARRHRRVTEIDSAPGPWDESKLPHTVEIMEAISQPFVREAYLCMPERAGKTQILLNAAGRKIDQGSQSGNIFWLMPTEAEAKKAMAERIIPMLKATDDLGRPGRLARYLSRYDDDTKRGAIRFNHGVRLFPAWSNSPASMASYFGELNIGDEIDKFESATKEGSDALTLLRKRGRDDSSRSLNLFASTPGRARKIYHLATEAAQQVKQFYLRCPHCSELINPDEKHLDIGPDATVIDIELNGCDIACPECGGVMDEQLRAKAFRTGTWVITKGKNVKRPETIGRHMSAFVLPMVPLKEIAAAFIKSKGEKLSDKVAFANGYKVEDYTAVLSDRREDSILALCDDRDAGVVHPSSDMLTIAIDTQDKGFWYVIRSWQYGPALTSWLVKCGYVPSARFDDFSALDKLLFEDKYFDVAGREYNIGYGIIDSGGHRTREVYEWCKRTGIFAAKGAKGRKVHPVSVSIQDYYPGTNVKIPNGLKLYTLDTHWHKDILADKLTIDPSDPGALVLHSGYSAIQREMMAKDKSLQLKNGLTVYAQHFSVEYKNDKNMWEQPAGKRNDLWDCEQQGMALAYYLGFDKMVSEKAGQQQPKAQQSQPQQSQSTAAGRPGWFHNRGR